MVVTAELVKQPWDVSFCRVQRRLLSLRSIALTAVMPTSIRMAASRMMTINGVSWSCPFKCNSIAKLQASDFSIDYRSAGIPTRQADRTSC